jgi:hypothetical protein
LGILYEPLRFALPLLVLAIIPPAAQAVLSGQQAYFRDGPRRKFRRQQLAAMTAWLHFVQPAARLIGRLRQGLTPWRQRGPKRLVIPWAKTVTIWSGKKWRGPEERLKALEAAMREIGAVVVHGGDFDTWDLEARGGMLGCARAQMVIEEHGEKVKGEIQQLVRLRVWPVALPSVIVAAALFAILGMDAALSLDWAAWAALNLPAVLIILRVMHECGSAMEVILSALPATLKEGEQIIVSNTKR